MRIRLVVFGAEVFLLELSRQNPEELLAGAFADMQQDDDDEHEHRAQFNYGPGHCHIERSPECDDWGDDRKHGNTIGFR
jgi:hypothetical protein